MELIRNVRLRRLQWVGCVLRMKDERVPKKALKGYVGGRRSGGRWIDAVDKDAKSILKCKNWRRSAEGRHICLDIFDVFVTYPCCRLC